MSDRVPCINPRCRRTFKNEGAEMICGKCFRMLPETIRAEHRRYWRELRKWRKRITRTSDELKIARMHDIADRWSALLGRHWDAHIKAYFLASEKPAGLDAFLEELRL